MNDELICNSQNTDKALEFYKKYKIPFGEIVKAEMESNPEKIKYVLTLTNINGDVLKFNGGLTLGYIGKGTNRTREILQHAGFHVSEEFIANNTAFKLKK